jgi:hypothetical protein
LDSFFFVSDVSGAALRAVRQDRGKREQERGESERERE